MYSSPKHSAMSGWSGVFTCFEKKIMKKKSFSAHKTLVQEQCTFHLKRKHIEKNLSFHLPPVTSIYADSPCSVCCQISPTKCLREHSLMSSQQQLCLPSCLISTISWQTEKMPHFNNTTKYRKVTSNWRHINE